MRSPAAQPIDKELVGARYRRSRPRYDQEAGLQRRMARTLVALLERLGRTAFPRALEIGCGSGLLTAQIARRLRVGTLYANDLDERCGPRLEQALDPAGGPELRFLGGDIEGLAALPSNLDLVASNAVFHWLGDPEALIARLADGLKPGSLLAFSTFGPDNLREVRELTGLGLPYRSLEELRATLSRRYRLLHAGERRARLRFGTPRGVLEHLRRTGANGLARRGWTKGGLRSFEAEYRRRFGLPGGAVSLTYHPLLVVAERR